MHRSLSMGCVVRRVLGAERVTVHIRLQEREGLGQTWGGAGQGQEGRSRTCIPTGGEGSWPPTSGCRSVRLGFS